MCVYQKKLQIVSLFENSTVSTCQKFANFINLLGLLSSLCELAALLLDWINNIEHDKIHLDNIQSVNSQFVASNDL